MKHTSVFVTIAFLAGLGTGLFAHSAVVGRLLRKDPQAADLAAIEKLHQEDIAVTLSQDPKGLTDIWTEDAVRFISGKPPVVGKQAIAADNEKGRAQYPGLKVLSYVPKFENIQVGEGLASEWFESEATFRLSPERPVDHWHGTGLRVLRRQSDGLWKFVVLILNQ